MKTQMSAMKTKVNTLRMGRAAYAVYPILGYSKPDATGPL